MAVIAIPDIAFLRTVRQLITHPRLGISDGLPFTKSSCLRTSDNRLQDTSILRSAQMFVRYEAFRESDRQQRHSKSDVILCTCTIR